MPPRPSTSLAPSPSPAALARLVPLLERANAYAADSRAGSTKRGYLTDFASFTAWCTDHGLDPMPANVATIAVYLSNLADRGKRASTIERALTGIAHAHRARGFAWHRGEPVIANVMTGIRRTLGTAPQQKAPVVDEELDRLLAVLDPTKLADVRDRAVLTFGWWGAFRRSELVALTTDDLTRTAGGIVAMLRRSKTDQAGAGATKGIPFTTDVNVCPVRALDAWLAASEIKAGALFRSVDRFGRVSTRALSGRSVALIVQRTAVRAGLDPHNLAAHSLRAGFATTAALKGRSLEAIMRQTLHKSERVARGYVRIAKAFDGNPAVGLR